MLANTIKKTLNNTIPIKSIVLVNKIHIILQRFSALLKLRLH